MCKSGFNKAFHVLKSCAGLPGNENVTITKDSVSSTCNGVQNKFGAGRLPACLHIAKQRKRSILRGWIRRRKLRSSLRGEAKKARTHAFNICDNSATVNRWRSFQRLATNQRPFHPNYCHSTSHFPHVVSGNAQTSSI